MQLHVCLLLVLVVTSSVQGEPRNSTEEHAIPVPHSDRDFASPSPVASDYTSTQEPYGGSESGPATPSIASGSPDSGALRLPEEAGNNGGETSVTGLPVTVVLPRNTQTNPGTPEGTRGYHTSRQSAFPPVTSSPASWTLLATPAGATGTVHHQTLRRTSSSGMGVFEKLTSGPVWGSMWSQTDSSQSTQRTTRLPDATQGMSRIFGSLWTTRDAIMVSGRIQNSSGSEDGRGTPRLTSSMSIMKLGVSEDGMGTPGYMPQIGVLSGSRVGTGTPRHSPHVSTVLASGGVPNSSASEDYMGTPRYTPQVGVLNLGFSEDGGVTPGHSTQVSTVMASDRFLRLGDSQDGTETARHTPQGGLLSLGGSEDRTGTPHVSTVLVSGSEDGMETPQYTPQVGLLNIGVSHEGAATPGHSPHASTILESREVQKLSGAEDGMRTAGNTPQAGVLSLGGSKDGIETPGNPFHASTVSVSREVLSFGGSKDGTGTSGHLPHASTVTVSRGVLGFGGSLNTDDARHTTPTPTALKNLPSVSPSILEVLAQGYKTTAPPLIRQGTPKTEEKGTGDGNTATTQHLMPQTQSASTSSSGATTRLPKVYVVPDQAVAFRVESIELLLQIVVVESSSASGPDLEEDTIAWAEPYLQRAPGFSRMSGVWGSGRAVQILLEFDSVGALRWLSASGASTLLRRTGLDGAARFRGSKVVNITLGGVQADVCDWLLACPGGFRCVSRPNNYSCSSACHFDFCRHHGVCTHHPEQLPVCRCLAGDHFWFMGSRCDVRMTRARLVCTCVSILALAVALIGSLAFVAVRRYRAALIRAKVEQTRSSYRRFNHFDELSSRFWLRSASAGSADSVDNPAFTRSDELLHMRALDRPCCYHDDTLSLASASASSACTGRVVRLNTIYPDGSQYGWRGSELSVGDGVLDSGKASDLSVCSWPVEPIHWTPFPLLRQLAATHTAHAVRVSRPRSYCEGMELVDMNRSWTT
ncbi:mucin-2 [Phyllopteryx taeniolatus]|uniref:mucin-2 n=1 Tax=Phyllopteryx taeniolatus TaxID=161469 RepID=UPI002AD4E932|nr:mucin-2 [Phyllopteryx taeniolatus]